jgi:hypothetical protein
MFTKISAHIFAKELKSTFPPQSFFCKMAQLVSNMGDKGIYLSTMKFRQNTHSVVTLHRRKYFHLQAPPLEFFRQSVLHM